MSSYAGKGNLYFYIGGIFMKFLVVAEKARGIVFKCTNNCGRQRNCIDHIVCPFK